MYANQLTPASRAMLGAKYRINAAYSGALASAYAHARIAEQKGTLLVRKQDAQAEVEHRCGLFARQRIFVSMAVKWDDYQPGQVATFTYPRYGLDAGSQGLIVSVSKDYITRTIKLILWI